MNYTEMSAEQKERELYKHELGEGRGFVTLEQEAEKLGWPVLQGSPKQVAWALSIRRSQMQYVDGWVGRQVRAARQAGKTLNFDKAVARLAGIDSAKWWIEHREYDSQNLLLAAKHDIEAGRI